MRTTTSSAPARPDVEQLGTIPAAPPARRRTPWKAVAIAVAAAMIGFGALTFNDAQAPSTIDAEAGAAHMDSAAGYLMAAGNSMDAGDVGGYVMNVNLAADEIDAAGDACEADQAVAVAFHEAAADARTSAQLADAGDLAGAFASMMQVTDHLNQAITAQKASTT